MFSLRIFSTPRQSEQWNVIFGIIYLPTRNNTSYKKQQRHAGIHNRRAGYRVVGRMENDVERYLLRKWMFSTSSFVSSQAKGEKNLLWKKEAPPRRPSRQKLLSPL